MQISQFVINIKINMKINFFQMKCCGAQEYKDWVNTTFAEKDNSVPDSCCLSDVEGCGKGILNMSDDQVSLQ